MSGSKKINRNDTCPCGSGKKYKKCCLNNDEVYVFKIILERKRSSWKRIEIKGSQTLQELDQIIRDNFTPDGSEHLTMFYKGIVWDSEPLSGSFNPLGELMDGFNPTIRTLPIKPGDTFSYVYNFGNELTYEIHLEDTLPEEKGVKYPQITGQNIIKYHTCVDCKNPKAENICFECTEKQEMMVYTCNKCIVDMHPDHHYEEIFYH
jgi:hypothetical protein